MVSWTKKLRFYPLLITMIIGIDIDLYFGKFLHRTILERRVSFILGICHIQFEGKILLYISDYARWQDGKMALPVIQYLRIPLYPNADENNPKDKTKEKSLDRKDKL